MSRSNRGEKTDAEIKKMSDELAAHRMRRASGQSGQSGAIPRTKSFSRSVSRKSLSRSQSRSISRNKSRSFETPVDSPPTDEEAAAFEIHLNKNDDDALDIIVSQECKPASDKQALPNNALLSLDDVTRRGSYTKSQVSRTSAATTTPGTQRKFKFRYTQNRASLWSPKTFSNFRI